jgi:uncharacterized delta-60 repeat protein
MFGKKSFVINLALILTLLGGLSDVTPAKASAQTIDQSTLHAQHSQASVRFRDFRPAPAALGSLGTLDPGFDGDGLVTTAIGSYPDEARAVAIQSDGKIVVAGGFSNPAYHDFFLARYNSNGSLDTSFDTDGIASTDFGNDDVARALAIQGDGKILLAGYTNPSNSDAKLALARYDQNGSLDTSFDGDGRVITNLGIGYDLLTDIAIQADGKILAVGSKNIGINNDDVAVLRYNTDGTLDPTFDTDGIVTTRLGNGNDFAASVVIRPDGKIIVGGTTYNGSNMDFALLRYNTNGSLDTSFAVDGKLVVDFFGFEDRAENVAVQADGKIVAGGLAHQVTDGYGLVRVNP